MGLLDRFRDLDTPIQVGVVLAVAGVALVVLVVLLFVLAAVLGSFVLGLGGEAGAGGEVAAGATVQADADAGEVAVTFTSNRNADYLLVEWTAEGGDVTVAGTEGDATAGDGSAELRTVGSEVVLAESDPSGDTTVTVTVTAVAGGERAPILEREVTI